MPRRSRPYPSAARAAVLALMLLASRPAAVDGFAAIHRGGWCGIRSDTGPVRSSSGGGRGGEYTRSSTSSTSIGGGSCCRASRTLLMGASRDDHTNRRDQWEGWDMEDNGGEDEVMLDVKRRDWRQFRKDLVARYGEDNGKDPWADGCWAHDIGTVEAGSLLLATEEIRSGTFHQSVILILSHGRDQGTLGLILNRPGPQRLHSLPGLQPDLAEVFGNSQVFDGGPMGLGTMTVLHDANVVGSDPVLNGVYAGGFDSLVEATRKGRVSKDHVRFVHGHSAWSPGQLQGELDHNQWFVAAAAPELITGNCDKPFDPLWGKLLRLMGGRYGDVAKRNEPRM